MRRQANAVGKRLPTTLIVASGLAVASLATGCNLSGSLDSGVSGLAGSHYTISSFSDAAPTPTLTPNATPSPTGLPSATPAPSAIPSAAPSASPTPSPQPSVIVSPIPRPTLLPSPTPSPSPSPVALPTYPPVSISGTELVPVEIQLQFMTGATSVQVTGLPSGAIFDNSSLTVRWIPKVGQAGTYTIQLTPSPAAPAKKVVLTISAASAATLAAGPTGNYKDDDIGYVFVHGAGANYCADPTGLANYWAGTPSVVEPIAANRTVACYDGTQGVAATAASVAQQILNANCGKFNRCIVITHSMGGLMLEHILLHARPAQAGDADPSMYANHALYAQVRDKLLFVVSLASAAGGSKAASIVDNPGKFSAVQYAAGVAAQYLGERDGSTANLDVAYASNVVAPMTEDPQVPFFMVPGFTVQTAKEAFGTLATEFEFLLNQTSDLVLNNDQSLTVLDAVASYNSRGDGLVDLRSACGVQSNDPYAGPGYGASLLTHLSWCAQAPKKPNHFVWFGVNLNHYLIKDPVPSQCGYRDNPCFTAVPSGGNFYSLPQYAGLSAIQVLRNRLMPGSAATGRVPAQIKLGAYYY